EIAVAGPLGGSWDRLDAWRLFDENYELVVNKKHPLAGRNRVSFAELASLRLFSRPYCEQAEEMTALLKSEGLEQKSGDHFLSDQDLLALIDANIGVSLMPETARLKTDLCGVSVEDLAMKRSVYLYTVAGRERSAAATGLMKLLRAADWSRMLPAA